MELNCREPLADIDHDTSKETDVDNQTKSNGKPPPRKRKEDAKKIDEHYTMIDELCPYAEGYDVLSGKRQHFRDRSSVLTCAELLGVDPSGVYRALKERRTAKARRERGTPEGLVPLSLSRGSDRDAVKRVGDEMRKRHEQELEELRQEYERRERWLKRSLADSLLMIEGIVANLRRTFETPGGSDGTD